MSHIRGESREQATMFPEALDDLIAEHAQVRVIDAFVNQLDLLGLGFGRAVPAATGRPGYDPSDVLKLYVYGYLNQVRSSRRLEREAGRNVELLWLLNKLRPDFKTIADFRRDNVKAIVGACRAFTVFCREQGLFGAELVAIDGSKFQAAASRKQVWNKDRVARAQAAIDQRIVEYLAQLDASDADEPTVSPHATQAALNALSQQRERLQTISAQLENTAQHVSTEPDAKLMRTVNHGHQVAYNVQTAVDAKHSLIADFAVTNEGNDHRQLAPIARAVKQILQAKQLTVLADAGYQNGQQAKECEAHGITPIVPASAVVNPHGEYFSKDHFHYDTERDQYTCPADQRLTRYKSDQRLHSHYYTTKACAGCELKARCTAAKQRSIVRDFHADALERMNQRAKDQPALMKRRKAIVEHPFAGLKYLLGTPRFLVRGIEKVSAEMALTVCGYNLKRTMNILGAAAMIKAWASA
jgi:transposase/IS5 family transposase